MLHPNQSERCALPEFFGAVIDFYDHFYASGKATKPTRAQSALKMIEEAGEFAGKISKSRPKQECEDEWADTLFALLHTAVVCDFEITKAMARIAAKNYNKFDTATVVNGIIVKKEDQVTYDVGVRYADDQAPHVHVEAPHEEHKAWWNFWKGMRHG